MEIGEIINFSCPRWNQLPDKPIFNKEAVEYINEILAPILDQDSKLTTTKVQNYVKWGLIPKEEGRKYSKVSISHLIVISIYKQAINLSNVKKGVDLLLKHFPLEVAYDNFGQAVDNAIRNTFYPIIKKDVEISNKELACEEIGLYAVANSFAHKLLGNIIIDSNGIENLGVNNE